MCLGGDSRINLHYLPVRAEKEGDAVGYTTAVQYPECLRRSATLVGEEREVEIMLRGELAVRLGRVERDAVDLDTRPLVVVHPVAEGAGLLGATGGVILGVEVEDRLLSAEILSREPLSVLGNELDVRKTLTLLWDGCHKAPSAVWMSVTDPNLITGDRAATPLEKCQDTAVCCSEDWIPRK